MKSDKTELQLRNTMIYNKKYIWSLSHFGTELLKPLGFPMLNLAKVLLDNVNKVTFLTLTGVMRPGYR